MLNAAVRHIYSFVRNPASGLNHFEQLRKLWRNVVTPTASFVSEASLSPKLRSERIASWIKPVASNASLMGGQRSKLNASEGRLSSKARAITDRCSTLKVRASKDQKQKVEFPNRSFRRIETHPPKITFRCSYWSKN